MTLEKVTIEDTKELLAIYAPYVERTAISFEYEVPTEEEFAERIQTISSKYPYIKAVVDGEIVGYAYANTFKARKAYDWSVETTIYVKQSCRRGGVGRVLYDQLEKSLRGMGILNMNACIASPIKPGEYLTDDSIRFHEAMGFVRVGTFHKSGFKFHQWFDMVWMEKLLGEHDEEPGEVRLGRWGL